MNTPPDTHQSGRDRFVTARKTGKIYGSSGQYAEIKTAKIVIAPAEIADTLGLPHGSQVIMRHRITRSLTDAPVSVSTSWLPAELAKVAPRLLETHRIVEGTQAYLERQTGRRAKRGQDRIKARLIVDPQEVSELGLSIPAAVLVNEATLWDESGALLEFGISMSHPDRWLTYQYELTEESQ